MPGMYNDANHCFGCDSEEIKYQSLKPQRATNITRTLPDGRNTEVDVIKGSKDYNVCEPCYLAQYAEVYPGDDLPDLTPFAHHG